MSVWSRSISTAVNAGMLASVTFCLTCGSFALRTTSPARPKHLLPCHRCTITAAPPTHRRGRTLNRPAGEGRGGTRGPGDSHTDRRVLVPLPGHRIPPCSLIRVEDLDFDVDPARMVFPWPKVGLHVLACRRRGLPLRDLDDALSQPLVVQALYRGERSEVGCLPDPVTQQQRIPRPAREAKAASSTGKKRMAMTPAAPL